MNDIKPSEEEIKKYTYEELFAYVLQKYELKDSKKVQLMFSYAWEYGHSSGNFEVLFYVVDLVDLIKNE